MTNLPNKDEVMTIFKAIGDDVQTLVRQEGLLLRAELKQDAQQLARVGGKLALGGVAAGMGFVLLVLAVVFALSWAVPELPLWGSFALVGSLLLVSGGVLFSRAMASAKEMELTPRHTLQSLKKDLRVLAPGA